MVTLTVLDLDGTRPGLAGLEPPARPFTYLPTGDAAGPPLVPKAPFAVDRGLRCRGNIRRAGVRAARLDLLENRGALGPAILRRGLDLSVAGLNTAPTGGRADAPQGPGGWG